MTASTGNNSTATFAFGPSQETDILDYKTKEGKKEFEKATTGLDKKFDGKADKMIAFKEELRDRTNDHGWDGDKAVNIIMIPKDGQTPGNDDLNVLDKYGQLSIQTLTLWANRFIVAKQDRRSQNNHNMVKCLKKSISSEVRAYIALKKNQYTVKDVEIAPMLYKCIMGRAEVDTKSTCAVIRRELSNLDSKMQELECNVSKFVEDVRQHVISLENRGESMNDEDLLLNIFTGLREVKDKTFREKFMRLEDEVMMSETFLTPEELLTKAETNYKVRIQTQQWEALSPEEEEIIAMQATITKLQDENLKLVANKQGKKGGSRQKTRKIKARDQWKFENKKGLKELTRGDNTYYWCPYHNDGKGMWTAHKPSEHKGKPDDVKTKSKKKKKDSNDENDENADPNVQAMAAVQELGESDDESDSDGSQG
eukprot:CAMPEP_0178954560 /NCGR_PEP_ID=MMETSP0789-20121207/9063_1 /TAXON_ID=3005 /ORGANISM="Rhizosolenia setigera, Strain CCMP 1694" /LENGTH=424 /DNA_ID=CAMNT_0020635985 /DNA_START=586 /DNA_END=1860 /DNA_ORIENTATION=+